MEWRRRRSSILPALSPRGNDIAYMQKPYVQPFHRCASDTVVEEDLIGSLRSLPGCVIRVGFYLKPIIAHLSKLKSRREAEWLVFGFVRSPYHDERLHAAQELVVEGGDERQVVAVGYVDGEFGWVVAVGCFLHFVALIVNLLAGHEEVFAWWCCRFVELDGAIFVRFGSIDEVVDLVASLGGEFEGLASMNMMLMTPYDFSIA
jgi:hypothetical protein